MYSEYTFLRIYRSLAKQEADKKELYELYRDLSSRVEGNERLEKFFGQDIPDSLTVAIAIDAVAHEIHANGNEVLQTIFPGANYQIVKSELDELAGLESKNEIRKLNRGYFTTLLSDSTLLLLEKQQVGMTTKEDITDAIKEYEKLYKAGIASKAEILTLARYYPDDNKYKQIVIAQGFDEEDKEPLIVGGPASVELVDKEGHLITTEALEDAFERFMANFRTRNSQIFHCLTPDTRILVNRRSNRYLPISSIKIGDFVSSHTGEMRKVNRVITHEVNGEILEISLSNGEVIRITDEHPVLTRDRGWVKAGELRINDILLHLRRVEEVGRKISVSRKGKGTGKRDHYTVTDKHNSQQRKGKTWAEVYGHVKPYYGGCTGEKNPAFGKRGRITGEKNPNWDGGKSFLQYPKVFDLSLKELVRQMSGFKCEKCGLTEEESLLKHKRRLSVHHKDFNKKNNQLGNLQSLCAVCHTETSNLRYAELRKEKLVLVNGTKILGVNKTWYQGLVYNLEIDVDRTYAGKGIIYHNSDVQIGWILPAYINKNGQVFKSGVDDKGLWVITEVRDDSKIAERVKEEIQKGNIQSYSIAGSATETENMAKGVNSFTQVNGLDLAEITLCFTKNSKIWTKGGLINIENVAISDYVYTHKNRYRSVTDIFVRDYNDVVLQVTTDRGCSFTVTPEHPIRTFINDGRHVGTHYSWIEAKKLKIGDLVSSHLQTGFCDGCGAPLFKKVNFNMRTFCCEACRWTVAGNRSGKTLASGDIGALQHSLKTRGITKKENPNLSGGIKTLEGRAIQKASVTSEEFKRKRSIIHREKCKDPVYIETVLRQGANKAFEAKLKDPIKYQKWYQAFVGSAEYEPGRLSGPEKILQCLLEERWPNIWKYVGDGSHPVDRLFPDFWNGDGKLIEVFGDYWHKNDDGKWRVNFFKKHGYETLIIWEHELKEEQQKIIDKIEEFSNNALSKIVSITQTPYSGKVYNLEVEEDHSYTTEACVAHNCAKGVNQGAHFDILKSIPEEPQAILASDILDVFASREPEELSNYAVVLETSETSFPTVVICSDRRNSLTDEIQFKLQKMLPDDTSIIVKPLSLVSKFIPVYNIEIKSLQKDVAVSTDPGVFTPTFGGNNQEETRTGTVSRRGKAPFKSAYFDELLLELGEEVKDLNTKISKTEGNSAISVFSSWITKHCPEHRSELHRRLLDEYGFPEEVKLEDEKLPVPEEFPEPWTVNESGEESWN